MKRPYTLTEEALAQRRRASKRGGEATAGKARRWTNIRCDTEVISRIDAQRGDLSRNDYLRSIVPESS